MRSATLLTVLCLLAGCVSNEWRRSAQVVVIHGTTEIEIRMPKAIYCRDLEGLVPPIEVRGPEGMQVTCLVFGDANGDARWTEDEPTRQFVGRAVAGGAVVDSVHVTHHQLAALGASPRLGLRIEEGGQTHFYSQALE